MAVVLNDFDKPAKKNHSLSDCLKELPGELKFKYWGINDYARVNIAHGTVARCSCNRLWQIRYDIISVLNWSTPSLYNRIKYRNAGKEVDA